jgi:hypothetical protein
MFGLIVRIAKCANKDVRPLIQMKQYSKGLAVLIAAGIKISIFWDMKSCSPLKVNRRFGGTSLAAMMLVSSLTYSSTQKTEATCPSEMSINFNGPHGVISQKTEFFETIQFPGPHFVMFFSHLEKSLTN